MKKSIIALAVLAASGAALAQSSVTLYGRLDVSVAATSKETTGVGAVPKLKQSAVNSSDLNTTFWGLKGSEDLGSGLKAIFKLEAAFGMDTGASTGTLFEREAHVGLSGSFGTVKAGRLYSVYDSIYALTNYIDNTNLATTTDVWKNGAGIYATRTNNAVSYESNSYDGFSAAVVYGLGEDKTAALTASRHFSVGAKYAMGNFLVAFAHAAEKPLGAGDVLKNTLIGGSYDFGVAKITGGINQGKLGQSKDDEYQVGVKVPYGPAALQAGYSRSKNKLNGLQKVGSGFSIVGTYSLSKRTTAYAGYESTTMDQTAGGTTKVETTNLTTGIRHLF